MPATELAACAGGVPAGQPRDEDAARQWDDDRAAQLLAELPAALAPGSGLEELARVVAAESVLDDLDDEQVQAALAVLTLALHRCGLAGEGLRVQARLDEVDPVVPVGRRAAQSAELAVELAAEALAPARRPP
ncbi:MAG TPA: hypothetical protein VFP72_16325, partial [Kineosporiaceae bacterium]|nr:hypothetical protein [Kineosporiaceae bacterium]